MGCVISTYEIECVGLLGSEKSSFNSTVPLIHCEVFQQTAMAQQWYGKDCNSAPCGFPFPIYWWGCPRRMGEMACDWHSKLNFAVTVAVWTFSLIFFEDMEAAVSCLDMPCLWSLNCALLSGARVPLSPALMTADWVSACLATFPSRQSPAEHLHRFVNAVRGKEKKHGVLCSGSLTFTVSTIRAALLSFGLCCSGLLLKHYFFNGFHWLTQEAVWQIIIEKSECCTLQKNETLMLCIINRKIYPLTVRTSTADCGYS